MYLNLVDYLSLRSQYHVQFTDKKNVPELGGISFSASVSSSVLGTLTDFQFKMADVVLYLSPVPSITSRDRR
jgi:hypothetical protein